MARYEAIESRRWFNRKTGATASIYGSTPYISAADKPNWSIKTVGYTVRDNQTGTIGTGRTPVATPPEAQAIADKLNAKANA